MQAPEPAAHAAHSRRRVRAINQLKNSLSEALEPKTATPDGDVEPALKRCDYLTADHIFGDVAKDDDSHFINNATYNRSIGTLEVAEIDDRCGETGDGAGLLSTAPASFFSPTDSEGASGPGASSLSLTPALIVQTACAKTVSSGFWTMRKIRTVVILRRILRCARRSRLRTGFSCWSSWKSHDRPLTAHLPPLSPPDRIATRSAAPQRPT